MTRRKWIVSVGVVVLFAAGLFAVLRARNATAKSTEARPFRLGKVQQSSLQVSVREVGVVDPVAKVEVKSPVSGRVIGLNVREGAAIKVGDVLAEVEPDVNQAQSLSDVNNAVTQAQLRLKDAEREYASQKQLFDRDLVARSTLSEYETKRELAAGELRAAQMRYRIVEDRGIPISGNAASQKARIKSPMAGTVIKRTVELGESVMSGVSSFNGGTVLFTVADLRSLIIRVNLNEVDIAKVDVGQPVRITLDAYPQKVFTGKDELAKHLRTGMSANVEILGEKRDNTLSIPLEALQKHEAQTVAYQLKKDLRPDLIRDAKEGLNGRSKFIWLSEHWKDYFNVVPIKAGIATLERVEVLEGLSESDEVALEDPSRRKIEKDDENN